MQLKNLFKMLRYSEPALTESREYVIWNPEYRGLNMQTVHDLVEYERVHGSISSTVTTSDIDELIQAFVDQTNFSLHYAAVEDVYWEELEQNHREKCKNEFD